MTALCVCGANTASCLGKKKKKKVLLVFILQRAIYDPCEKVRHKTIRNYWMINSPVWICWAIKACGSVPLLSKGEVEATAAGFVKNHLWKTHGGSRAIRMLESILFTKNASNGTPKLDLELWTKQTAFLCTRETRSLATPLPETWSRKHFQLTLFLLPEILPSCASFCINQWRLLMDWKLDLQEGLCQ